MRIYIAATDKDVLLEGGLATEIIAGILSILFFVEHHMRRYLRRNLVGWAGIALVVLFAASLAKAAGKIYYGSRAGMTLTVKSMSDLDTSHAVILTEHTRDDAIGFCRDYERQEPVTETCIRQELAVRLNDLIHADCPKGVFTDFYGEKYQFRGKNPRSKESGAAYLLMNLRTHEMADGSSASGYDVNMDIFRALCPRTAPPAD